MDNAQSVTQVGSTVAHTKGYLRSSRYRHAHALSQSLALPGQRENVAKTPEHENHIKENYGPSLYTSKKPQTHVDICWTCDARLSYNLQQICSSGENLSCKAQQRPGKQKTRLSAAGIKKWRGPEVCARDAKRKRTQNPGNFKEPTPVP